jgi:glutamate synthase domain-containing protein 1
MASSPFHKLRVSERKGASSEPCTSSASRSSTAVDHLSLSERSAFYIVSLSANTLIYKGMLTRARSRRRFPI